ncbi:MAG: hypothetical protein EU539_13730 [Promethearchaeota archaeon]|nr:MAG: hypothetical protein EU539_13730 [Candidatus Lokiarchaeota archaeon]
MENLTQIKKEISEKKGKEWLGLQKTTEKQLESFKYYLDHPKLKQNEKLIEEMTNLYTNAKATNFTKMEKIIRKLDQLSITLGQYDIEEKVEKKLKFLNYPQAIKELKRKIELMMQSPLGTSLPEITQKSLITFINYCNHPDLHKKPKLFDIMYDKYDEAKKTDFMKMRSFDQMLNMIEIKLGTITEEIKTYKTLDEKVNELEDQKKVLNEEWEKLELEKEKFKQKEADLAKEWEKLREEQNSLKIEKAELKKQSLEYHIELSKFKEDKENLAKEWKKLDETREKLEGLWQKFEESKNIGDSE